MRFAWWMENNISGGNGVKLLLGSDAGMTLQNQKQLPLRSVAMKRAAPARS